MTTDEALEKMQDDMLALDATIDSLLAKLDALKAENETLRLANRDLRARLYLMEVRPHA